MSRSHALRVTSISVASASECGKSGPILGKHPLARTMSNKDASSHSKIRHQYSSQAAEHQHRHTSALVTTSSIFYASALAQSLNTKSRFVVQTRYGEHWKFTLLLFFRLFFMHPGKSSLHCQFQMYQSNVARSLVARPGNPKSCSTCIRGNCPCVAKGQRAWQQLRLGLHRLT